MAIQHHKDDGPVSFEEYLAILEADPEHRYEYLDGEISMMTGGSPDHSIIGGNMVRILGNLLQGRRCIVYNSDAYIELANNSRVCPDVTISCDSRDRGAKDVIRHPSVVVEVLSPATEARDRGKKSLCYRAKETIQEYLLVNTDAPIIELFRREKNKFWALYTLGLNDTVELASLAARFRVADVYQNTALVDEEGQDAPS